MNYILTSFEGEDKLNYEITLLSNEKKCNNDEKIYFPNLPSLLKHLITFHKKDDVTSIYYRGQNNEYEPIPSIFRNQHKHLIDNETEYYQEVYTSHPLELGHIEDRADLFAIMQHYGCPTRLLDVTVNPYIALQFMCDKYMPADNQPSFNTTFFIFSQKKPKKPIVKINKSVIEEELDLKSEFNILKPQNIPHINQRIAVQQGQFIYFDQAMTAHNSFESLAHIYSISKVTFLFQDKKSFDHLKLELESLHYFSHNLYPNLISKSNYYKNSWKKKYDTDIPIAEKFEIIES